jgi:hypothetical protein
LADETAVDALGGGVCRQRKQFCIQYCWANSTSESRKLFGASKSTCWAVTIAFGAAYLFGTTGSGFSKWEIKLSSN